MYVSFAACSEVNFSAIPNRIAGKKPWNVDYLYSLNRSSGKHLANETSLSSVFSRETLLIQWEI